MKKWYQSKMTEKLISTEENPEVSEIKLTVVDKYERKSEIIMNSKGEFIINGKLIETDIKVYHGFKDFINISNTLKD